VKLLLPFAYRNEDLKVFNILEAPVKKKAGVLIFLLLSLPFFLFFAFIFLFLF
jgi:hypothetical protein